MDSNRRRVCDTRSSTPRSGNLNTTVVTLACTITQLKEKLNEIFSIEGTQRTRHILIMQCYGSKNIIWLFQMDYVQKVLRIFNMENSEADVDTALDVDITDEYKISHLE